MKILVMADGHSIHTEKWIYGLSLKDELDIYLLTMNPEGIREGIVNNARVKHIYKVYANNVSADGSNYGYLKNILRIRKIVKDLAPDVISTVYLTSYGFIGALVKGNAVLSHFIIGSDVMITPFRNLLYLWLTRFTLSRGDLLVSSSITMTNKIKGFIRLPEGKLLTQQYGVGEEVVNYPVQVKKYDFISNRAWVSNSNITIILDIFSIIDLPVKLALIGDNGPLENEIKKQLASLPHAEHLGMLPYIDNIDAVAKSKFYVSLTSSDGASLSLMEAMAVGAIPIVSNIEPNREWVEDGINGFVVDIGNLSETADKFREICRLPESVLQPMREKNRDIIRCRGRLTTNMNRFTDKLIEVVNSRRN